MRNQSRAIILSILKYLYKKSKRYLQQRSILQLCFFELYRNVYNFQDKGMPHGRKIMIDLSYLYLAMDHIYSTDNHSSLQGSSSTSSARSFPNCSSPLYIRRKSPHFVLCYPSFFLPPSLESSFIYIYIYIKV